MKAQALRVSIFEDKRIGNCSNHGISEKYNNVLILNADGPEEVDLDNPPENLCILVHRTLFGKEADYVRPYADPTGAGWMSGGALVWTSDSRFECSHPLQLHDRQESWELYNSMN
jgi:hypothetical protein